MPSCSSAGPRRWSMRRPTGWASRRIASSILRSGPRTTPSARPESRRRPRSRVHLRISRRAQPRRDVVFVVLIGHGTFDGQVAKFNLPGPDMTAADFAPLLKSLKAKQVVFVNTASASGPFIAELSGPGRTVVTATRSGAERFRHPVRRLLRGRAHRRRRRRRSPITGCRCSRPSMRHGSASGVRTSRQGRC